MEQKSGITESAWLRAAEIPTSNLLPSDLASFDICVLGAGISGMTCAYRLASEGMKVLVMDRGPVGGGETCRTTAHLASAVDDRFMELERVHGPEGAKLVYESHAAAIDYIEKIIQKEQIECDFARVDGYLVNGEDAEDFLKEEYDAAVRVGVQGVQYPVDCPAPGLTDSPCIRFPQQGQFHPIKYLAGLTSAFIKLGGTIATGQLVSGVKESGKGVMVTVEGGRELQFPRCVDATNAPIVNLVAQLKQVPYRTYAIAIEVPKGEVQLGLYWDTDDPYHYVRLMNSDSLDDTDKELLIVGGEDHRTGMDSDPAERFNNLFLWAKKRFPHVGEVRYKWSGQVLEPVDGLAFIGKATGSNNIYIVTGDSGMGMTHGTLSSFIISDLIQGRTNRFASLYDPRRNSLRSLKEIIKGHAYDAVQLGKQLTPGEFKHREDIPPGHGAVIRHGLKKVATYCDENGAYFERSASCTHLGCVVEWNDVEKSWDCPCHGSRFATDGTVLFGPATTPLPEHK